MAGKRPALVVPEPLRGNELGTFTHHSVANRLPGIGRRVLAENAFPERIEAEIEALLESIPGGQIGHLPDTEAWYAFIKPYLGQTWLEVPWFFAETYFYRRILEATGYFGPGPGQGVDPYADQKQAGLESRRQAIAALCERVEEVLSEGTPNGGVLAELIRVTLWSNQADLSLWPAGMATDPEHGNEEKQTERILVDDTERVVDTIMHFTLPARRVDFLVDNAGFELVADLCLAIYLLRMAMVERVHLNVKAHPTFVSDAIDRDVAYTAETMASSDDRATAVAGSYVQGYLEEGRIVIRRDDFWTSPLAMWEMPDALARDLAQSALLICKGDANYRRLLGDRHWPTTASFQAITAYLPAPLVALRTLKSEVACGLRPGQAEAIARMDPTWMTNGRWGVIQFHDPGLSSCINPGEANH